MYPGERAPRIAAATFPPVAFVEVIGDFILKISKGRVRRVCSRLSFFDKEPARVTKVFKLR